MLFDHTMARDDSDIVVKADRYARDPEDQVGRALLVTALGAFEHTLDAGLLGVVVVRQGQLGFAAAAIAVVDPIHRALSRHGIARKHQ